MKKRSYSLLSRSLLFLALGWLLIFSSITILDYIIIKKSSDETLLHFMKESAGVFGSFLKEVPEEELQKYLSTIKSRENFPEIVLLANREGRIIASSEENLLGRYLPQDTKRSHLKTLTFNNTQLKGTSVPFGNGRSIYVFALSRHISSPFGFLFSRSLILLSISLILALITERFLFYRKIILPIRRVLYSDKSIIRGDYSSAVIPEEDMPRNEIGEFLRVRNRMLWRLLNHEKELKRWGEVLEQRVKARTKELEEERERLEILHRASYQLLQSKTAQDVAERIFELFWNVLKPEGGAIYREERERILLKIGGKGEREGIPDFVFAHPGEVIRSIEQEKKKGIIISLFVKDKPHFAFAFHGERDFESPIRELLTTITREASLRLESLLLLEKLKESEETYRVLFKNALVAHYLIQDGKFKMVNDELLRIFGYSEHEMCQLGPLDLTHPEDRKRVEENIKLRISGKVGQLKYQFRGITKSGEIRQLEVLGSRVIHKGKPAVQGTLIDITDFVTSVEREKRRLKQITLLHEIIRESFAELQKEKIAQKVASLLQEKLGYDVADVALIDRENQCLQFLGRASKATRREPINLPLVPGQGLTVTSVLEGRTIYAPEVSLDPRYKEFVKETRSELCTPIFGTSGMLGVINLERPESYAFDEVDILSVETLAAGVAKLLQAAELFQSAKRQAERLSQLRVLISRLHLRLHVGNILEEALCGILRLADADLVLVGEMEKGYLRIIDARGYGVRGVIGKVLKERERLLQMADSDRRVDVRRRDRTGPEWDLSPVFGKLRRQFGAPLSVEIKVEGQDLYFFALRKEGKPSFSKEARDIVEIYLSQAKVALLNAELFGKAKRQKRLGKQHSTASMGE